MPGLLIIFCLMPEFLQFSLQLGHKPTLLLTHIILKVSLFQPAASFHALSKYIIIFEASIPSVKLSGNLPTTSKVVDDFYPQNLAKEQLFTSSQLHFATFLSVLHKLLMANLLIPSAWVTFKPHSILLLLAVHASVLATPPNSLTTLGNQFLN